MLRPAAIWLMGFIVAFWAISMSESIGGFSIRDSKVLRLRRTRFISINNRGAMYVLCSWRNCRFSDPPLSLYDTAYRSVQSD